MVGVERMDMVICDCGALVPNEGGPEHAYMTAQPGCWRRYGELLARWSTQGLASTLHTDAYAAQHPGNASVEPRQRNSVAIHLIALCAHFEFGISLSELSRLRGGVSSTLLPRLGVQDWPALPVPPVWGPLNAPALLQIADRDLDAATNEWAAQVWAAWDDQHALVRGWVNMLFEVRYAKRP